MRIDRGAVRGGRRRLKQSWRGTKGVSGQRAREHGGLNPP